jgi:diguanylate cyclase (GGDEF)-like protein
MRFTLAPSDAHDTAAARQLAHGFAQLEFAEPLESEFRRTFRLRVLPWIRAGFAALAVLALLLWIADQLQLDAALLSLSALLRLGVMLPVALFGLALTFLVTRGDAAPARLTSVLLVVIALASILLDWYVARAGGSFIFSGLAAVLMVGFVGMGMRFWPALDTGAALALAGIAAVSFAGWSANQVIAYSLVLITVVAGGAAAAYAIEHAIRVAWLEALVIGHLGERDGLTGLFNRRMFDGFMGRVWEQAIEDKSLIVLMLIDVDSFRRYNDRFGLQTGDECIRKVAGAISACALRPLDFCARYSGIQFAIVLANPDRLYAEEVPRRVREAVAALEIPHPESPNGRDVTVSVGVALTVPRAIDSLESYIELAQTALREAHEQGGDRVVAKESESSLVQSGMFRAEVALATAQEG